MGWKDWVQTPTASWWVASRLPAGECVGRLWMEVMLQRLWQARKAMAQPHPLLVIDEDPEGAHVALEDVDAQTWVWHVPRVSGDELNRLRGLMSLRALHGVDRAFFLGPLSAATWWEGRQTLEERVLSIAHQPFFMPPSRAAWPERMPWTAHWAASQLLHALPTTESGQGRQRL